MTRRIKTSDLKIERIVRSGPGGQHRNRKATGIRLLHVPTGIRIMSTTERSQKQNLEKALAKLREKLKKLHTKRKKRKKTKPSKATKEKRLNQKRKQSEKKQHRQAVKW